MKRIDFYEKKKALHLEMEEAIAALFDKAGINEIDFIPDGGWRRYCFVIISPDGSESTREISVHKVKYEDGEICILPSGEDKWISCQHSGDVVTDNLDDLYDAVYEAVGNINREYYVCELDKAGKPTGQVNNVTWRIEYAEDMMEQRGFIYTDKETALLHAK